MSFKSNFERICAEKNVSPSFVCTKIGISTSNYSQWTEESVPRKTTLLKIADVLDVSVEELLAKEKSPSQSEELENRIDAIKSVLLNLSEEQQEKMLRAIEALVTAMQ